MIRLALKTLFAAVVILASVPGFAAGCNEFLSAPALSSEIEAPLSEPARAYVRLVNYYLQNQSRLNAEEFLGRLIKSESILNPFVSEKDTLSLQLNDALKIFIAKITQQDWVQIRAALVKIAKDKKSETDDRHQKKNKTSEIFRPKEVVNLVFEYDIQDAPTWHGADGRVFVSVVIAQSKPSSAGRVFIYELIGDKLIELATLDEILINPQVSWVTVDGQTYFTFISNSKRLNLYKLNKKDISFIESIELKHESYSNITFAPVAFNNKQEKVLLTYRDGDTHYLYELKNGRLEYFSKLITEKGEEGFSFHAWHRENGRNYISFSGSVVTGFEGGRPASTKLTVYLAEVNERGHAKLIDSKSKESNDFIENASLAHFSGSRIILDSFNVDEILHVFEIVNGALVVNEMTTDHAIAEKNFFKSKDDLVLMHASSFLLVGSLKERKFTFYSKGAFGNFQNIYFAEFKGRTFYSAWVNDGSVVVGELAENELIQKKQIDKIMVEPASRTWVQNDENLYVITIAEKNLKLTKMFSGVNEP